MNTNKDVKKRRCFRCSSSLSWSNGHILGVFYGVFFWRFFGLFQNMAFLLLAFFSQFSKVGVFFMAFFFEDGVFLWRFFTNLRYTLCF